MSMKIYESDYMSVVWEIWKYSTPTERELREENASTDYILLYFSVQVNWKLKTFPLKFDLSDNKNEIVKDDCLFKLKNYTDWYNVYETLKWMWYDFWDNINSSWSGNIINKWIITLSDWPKNI